VWEASRIVFLPFIAALAWLSPFHASSAGIGIIVARRHRRPRFQLWFRVQAKRSQFRRRQFSSRVATFAEAFSSITWAGTAALAAVGTWLALIAGVIAVCHPARGRG
jgi:ABC-2 type transport system permease protein